LRISKTTGTVSTTLDQDLEDLAFVFDGTPQIRVLARDPDDHFVGMAAIARSRTAPPQTQSDRQFRRNCDALVEMSAHARQVALDIAIA
jgi:hypothetical protein